MMMIYGDICPVDILAIGVHPDDVELSCAGTLLSHMDMGYSAAIVDLTKGELGTRGSADIRMQEATAAAEILGVSWRANLEMRDGFFVHDERHLLRVAEIIRIARPRIVLANSVTDRHPDHGRASGLVHEACFYAGLRRIMIGGTTAHRPEAVYYYIQDKNVMPDLVVDVTPYVEKKKKAIQAFSTQFFTSENTASDEPATPISSSDFMEYLWAKMRIYGRPIGAEYAEAYNVRRTLGVRDLGRLL